MSGTSKCCTVKHRLQLDIAHACTYKKFMIFHTQRMCTRGNTVTVVCVSLPLSVYYIYMYFDCLRSSCNKLNDLDDFTVISKGY